MLEITVGKKSWFKFKKLIHMKYITLIAAVLMMAVLSSCETRENKKYKKFYFEKITADMAMTEYYLMDTLNTLPKDSLLNL